MSSYFNPSSWLNRSRVFSEGSIDISATDDSLSGLKYASSVSGNNNTENVEERLTTSTSASASHHSRHQSMPVISTSHYSMFPQGYVDPYHDTKCPVTIENSLRINFDDEEDENQRSISYSHSISQNSTVGIFTQSVNTADDIDITHKYPNTSRTKESFQSGTRSCARSSSHQRRNSYGNSSVISGLSADETHYCGDDVKSYKSINDNHHYENNNNDDDDNPKVHTRQSTQGRDFGDAFDHLIYDPEVEDNQFCKYKSSNYSSSSASRNNKHCSQNTHYRSKSDTIALCHPSKSYYNTCTTHNKSSYIKKSIPAHATLREQLLFNGVPKPQIIQSRSTSNTAQSLSSTSTSCATEAFRICSVQQLPPINNTATTFKGTYGLRSVPSSGSGLTHPSIEQSEDGTNSSQHSVNSYRKHNDLLGTRPRRNLYLQHASACNNNYTNSSSRCSSSHGGGGNHDERSLQDVPEDDPSTNWNDGRSIDGRPVLSNISTQTPRSKKKIKDEMKFMLKKLVPARLLVRKNNITLERSDGCLT